MISLTYVSVANEPFNNPSLQAIANQAAIKNGRLNITGYLYFHKNHFIQYLEGDKENVLTLMDTIELDPRHTVLKVILLGEIKDRIFPTWSMRFLTQKELSHMKVEHILEQAILELTPEPAQASAAHDLILKLVRTIAKINH